MLSSWEESTKSYGFAIINGVLAIRNAFPDMPRTREAAERFIKSTNDRVYNHSLVGTDDFEDIFS